MTIAVELQFKQLAQKKFWGFNGIRTDGSFHGLMKSINWPISSVWVFTAQLVEHCSANNADATGSNPVEALKNFFFGLHRNGLNCDSTAMVTYSFHLYSHSSHHFILYFFICYYIINYHFLYLLFFQSLTIQQKSANITSSKTPQCN